MRLGWDGDKYFFYNLEFNVIRWKMFFKNTYKSTKSFLQGKINKIFDYLLKEWLKKYPNAWRNLWNSDLIGCDLFDIKFLNLRWRVMEREWSTPIFRISVLQKSFPKVTSNASTLISSPSWSQICWFPISLTIFLQMLNQHSTKTQTHT